MPKWCLHDIIQGLPIASKYLSVIIPLFLVNLISTLANLESAHAVGDVFNPTETLVANSMITIVSTLFGNPFPTVLFIGQPALKAMGARIGYLILNGVIIGFFGAFHGICF